MTMFEEQLAVQRESVRLLELAIATKVKKQNAELIKALEFALEAVYNWGEYASDYFKEKHGFDADVKTIKDAITKAKGEKEDDR